MNAIVPYHFEDADVRVIERDGKPWFVLADLCAVLELQNPSASARPLDATERSKINLGRQGEAIIVSLPGMLTLTMRCKAAMKPGTMPYRARKWITGDLVPTVLQTGSYRGSPAPTVLDDATLRALLLGKMDRVDELTAENASLSGKAAALDRLAGTDGLLCMSDAGKEIGLRPMRFIAWLVLRGWIFKRPSGGYSAAQAKLNDGCLALKSIRIPRSNGTMQLDRQVMVTAKGLTKLAELVAQRHG